MTDNKLFNQSDSIKNSIKFSNSPSKQNSLKLVDNPSKVKPSPMTELTNFKKVNREDSVVNNSNLNESNIEKKNLLGQKVEERSNLILNQNPNIKTTCLL